MLHIRGPGDGCEGVFEVRWLAWMTTATAEQRTAHQDLLAIHSLGTPSAAPNYWRQPLRLGILALGRLFRSPRLTTCVKVRADDKRGVTSCRVRTLASAPTSGIRCVSRV